MWDVFISYSRKDDEAFVERLYGELTKAAVSVWWDRRAMESRGLTFLQEIINGISSSARLIAVVGPHAVRSDYVNAEWDNALLLDKVVVPVLRLGALDLVPEKLSGFHVVDFREDRPHEGGWPSCFAR